MIASVRGNVASVYGSVAVVDVSGVGYEVRCTLQCVADLTEGEEAQIIVYTDVREDNISLFGFQDQLEKQVFLLLTSVKGVGAKSALDIVSQVDKVDLLRAIGEGNVTALQALKGIGKKTAERMIVELKDKVAEHASSRVSSGGSKLEKISTAPIDEAVDALLALGFSRKEAARAVGEVESSGTTAGGADTATLVREALRFV